MQKRKTIIASDLKSAQFNLTRAPSEDAMLSNQRKNKQCKTVIGFLLLNSACETLIDHRPHLAIHLPLGADQACRLLLKELKFLSTTAAATLYSERILLRSLQHFNCLPFPKLRLWGEIPSEAVSCDGMGGIILI